MEQPEKNKVKDTLGLIQLKPVGVVSNHSQEASWGTRYQDLTWQERATRMKAQSQTISDGHEPYASLVV